MIYSKDSTYAQAEAREQIDGSILKGVFLSLFHKNGHWTETSVYYKAVHPFSYRVDLSRLIHKYAEEIFLCL